jgi:flagellar protein FliS
MAYTATGSAAYRRDDVLTASPLRLVVLTMNGAITRIERARRGAESGNVTVYRTELNRARALIAELLAALDRPSGGEIATQLESLYEFMLTKLLAPGKAPDTNQLAMAQNLMKTIKDGFDNVLASGGDGQS